jgi:hypothetical protein
MANGRGERISRALARRRVRRRAVQYERYDLGIVLNPMIRFHVQIPRPRGREPAGEVARSKTRLTTVKDISIQLVAHHEAEAELPLQRSVRIDALPHRDAVPYVGRQAVQVQKREAALPAGATTSASGQR